MVRRVLEEGIAAYNAEHGTRRFRLLAGCEVNINNDGSLDYADDVLEQLDWVIASIHTSFRMSKRNMTDRMVEAVRNPLVDCLGHPTGRMLLRREPYDVDIEAVVAAAAEAGTMIEINGNPNRRDLNDHNARLAAEAGVPIVCNTDAHRTSTLRFIEYSVATARRAGLTAAQVANTRTWAQLRKLRGTN
jgi:DNA polymerase (family 10)